MAPILKHSVFGPEHAKISNLRKPAAQVADNLRCTSEVIYM